MKRNASEWACCVVLAVLGIFAIGPVKQMANAVATMAETDRMRFERQKAKEDAAKAKEETPHRESHRF